MNGASSALGQQPPVKKQKITYALPSQNMEEGHFYVVLGEDMPLDQALDYETKAFALCCTTADMREGTQAFLERRKAQFTGQ